MLRFTRSGRPYVLRRGPKHLRPRSNVVIMRETQVLAALAGTDVPHPRLIASCDDPGVLGDAVFYLMEPIDGFNAGEELPELHAADPAVRFEMGLSMADALAKLGAVDYAAVGLSDYGKPDGFLERQVPRWLSELESYQEFENYPGPDIPGVDDVATWLERRPADGVDAGHHARRLPRGQRDVLPHRPRGRRDRRLGDVHDRRPAAGSRLAAGHLGTVRRVRRHAFREGRTGRTQRSGRALRPQHHPRPVAHHLVHRAGLLQARHRAGGHARPGQRRQGPEGGRRPAPRGHGATVRAGADTDGHPHDRFRHTRRHRGAARRNPRVRQRQDRARTRPTPG